MAHPLVIAVRHVLVRKYEKVFDHFEVEFFVLRSFKKSGVNSVEWVNSFEKEKKALLAPLGHTATPRPSKVNEPIDSIPPSS